MGEHLRDGVQNACAEQPENHASTKRSDLVVKNMVTYPILTPIFLKQPLLTDFKMYTHTPPNPIGKHSSH